MVTDTQVRKLIKEYEEDQNLSRAAMRCRVWSGDLFFISVATEDVHIVEKSL